MEMYTGIPPDAQIWSQMVAIQAAHLQMILPPTISMHGWEHTWVPQPANYEANSLGWPNPQCGQGLMYTQFDGGYRAFRKPTPKGQEAKNSVHMPSSYGPNREDAKGFPKELCTKLEAMLATEGEDCQSALAQMRNSVRELAMTDSGCRLVQAALIAACPKEAQVLAQEMRNHVPEAIKSPHANYVIQEIIQQLPTAGFIFIAEEMQKNAVMYSRHRYGCRVICRLLQHASTESCIVALVDEVLDHAVDLSQHSYGHHVMVSVLEHCGPRQRQRLVKSLQGDPLEGNLLRFAMSRNASFVIEKALECDDDLRKFIANELLLNVGTMVSLAQSLPGYFVLLALLKFNDDSAQLSKHYLETAPEHFQTTKYGRKLLEELGISGPASVQISAPTTTA